jgi:hypothetical protein
VELSSADMQKARDVSTRLLMRFGEVVSTCRNWWYLP